MCGRVREVVPSHCGRKMHEIMSTLESCGVNKGRGVGVVNKGRGIGKKAMLTTKKSKKRAIVNKTEGFPGRESRENQSWAEMGGLAVRLSHGFL